MSETVKEGDGDAQPLSPYHAARWARDRHVEELENRIRYLRALVFILCALCAVSVGGAVTLARQSRIVPYVVQVDRLGTPMAYGRVETMPSPQEAQVRAELGRFVDAMRTVHTDPVAQSKMIDRGYAYTRAAARSYVDAYFTNPRNNPYVLSRERIRLVDLRQVRRQAGTTSTWEIEWDEYEVPLRGGDPTVRSWQGTVRTAIVPPENEDQLLVNPLGVYVTDLSWNPLTEGHRVNLEDVRGALDNAANARLRESGRVAPTAVPGGEEAK